jgi:hypothetical protein
MIAESSISGAANYLCISCVRSDSLFVSLSLVGLLLPSF